MFRRSVMTLWGVALGILLSSGCGKEEYPKLPTVPAEGKVLYKNKPPVGAQVVLVPRNDDSPDSVKPRGTVGEDGVYRLTTYPQASGKPDGAPPGEYLVSVRWTTRKKQSAADEDEGGPPGPPAGVQGDRFGERYSNPKTSGLIVKVEADKPLETIILK